MKQEGTWITGEHYRISLLTEGLLRLEYAEDGYFEDRPTALAQNRNFPTITYRLWRGTNGIEISTSRVNLFYDGRPFSPSGLWAENRSPAAGIYATWRYGDPEKENLGGTARTLDEVEGETPLEPGILSRLCGYSLLDDSASPVLLGDGNYAPRRKGVQDLYLFCYGTDYAAALRDYFHLSGMPPLLPRYALGNWWSRYYPYSAEGYLELMNRFHEKGIPLSVAVLDMDWHRTDAGKEGKGWTGYTWNRDLFPQPAAFLDQLHRLGLRVALNLHPAEGIQAHEERYVECAEALGRDAENHQRIPFLPADSNFWRVYFDRVIAPLEEEGVDCWWLDWQQGTVSGAEGLDPLWALNDQHTRYAMEQGKRPLILSRYSGPGSHRYPVGFSGDSVISWKTLRFQPFFTATAANIGYGWWSHDIGGHTHGTRDPELQVRWLQFGVFSPILRMHSTSNRFNAKEPWRYAPEIEAIMTSLLRLRHRLIPYLYTANHLSHTRGEALVRPLYHAWPKEDLAYRYPNQYLFGTELMVAPITAPMDPMLERGSEKVWLPEGSWYDFFSGVRYRGGGRLRVYRRLSEMPVFARAGAIIPLADEEGAFGVENPKALEIRVFAGASGRYTMLEDDGLTLGDMLEERAATEMIFCWDSEGVCTFELIQPGERSFLPKQRDYRIQFVGVEQPKGWSVPGFPSVEKMQTNYEEESHILEVVLRDVPLTETVELRFDEGLQLAQNETLRLQEAVLNDAHIAYELKDEIFRLLAQKFSPELLMRELHCLDVPSGLVDALLEYME